MPKSNNNRIYFFIVALLSGLCYIGVGYFIQRHETNLLLPCYFIAFALYLWLFQQSEHKISFKSLLIMGIVMRLLLLPSLPSLSDDVFRFIWDGRLLANGINPYLQLPSVILENTTISGIDASLFNQLNSPHYFTVYPPIAQITFWLAAAISPNSIQGSIIILRVINIAADLGCLWLMIQLLAELKLSKHYALLYFINPLVILELTGNLHHEGIMLFFILGAIYFARKSKWNISGAFWAMAIATKLLPLLFFPFLLFKNKFGNSLKLFSSIVVIGLLLFLPFYSVEFFNGFSSSIGLYFQKFEFNASIYYLARQVGFWITGYNTIHIIGIGLALSTFLIIMYLSIKANVDNVFEAFILIFTTYLLLSTTVHPWYCITILGLTVFTHYRFTVIWSLLIFLSYVGYSLEGYNENLWLVAVEYIVVITVFIYEWKTKQSIKLQQVQL